MPKRPKFLPIEQPEGWMVSVPESMSGTGKRVRKFFERKTDAEKYAAKLRTQYHDGERSGVIPRKLAAEAAIAAKILEPYGISLVDAARETARRLDADGNAETFGERWRRVLQLGELHWRDSYARAMGKLDKKLPQAFMAMRCAAITPQIIQDALKEGGAKSLSTIETRSRHVASILSYKPRHQKTREISIMTTEQVAAMFDACEIDAERWAVGLMIYAGIRPSVSDGEITRLDWEAVSKEEVFVAQDVSKTKSERIIPMTPALARAIEGHPAEGTVIPANWKRRVDRLRKSAGVAGKADITRHTFASHFLAAYGEDAAKNAMGHTEGSRTLFKHYRRAVTEEAGRAFFE